MRRNYNILNSLHTRRVLLWGGLVLVLLILMLAASSVAGRAGEARHSGEEPEAVETEVKTDTGEPEEVESLTMAIELEEGGAIDLETSLSEVKINTWKGDAVLVIVERATRPAAGVEPMNIQVTRHGKDVRIQTIAGPGFNAEELGISFRILLPEGATLRSYDTKESYSLSKLTSVVMRALHKEAVRWIGR